MKFYSTFFLIFIGLLPTLSSQTDSYTMVERMGRGINLGNTFSAPVEGNWAPVVYEQYFIDIKEAGFTNVRIPMDFYGNRTSGSTSSYSSAAGTSSSYTGNTSDYVVDEQYLDRIEEVINWSLNQDLVTIIDFHGSELKSQFLYTFSNSNSQYTDPTSAKRAADLDKFKAIWLAIANRFKNYSDNLLFEIVNEPYFEVNATEMDALNSMIIAAIRSTGDNNTMRNIIITGGGETSQNAPQQIGDDIISSDDYLIASFHYYKPFGFTSSSSANYNDFEWGTASDKNTLDNHFDSVKDWSNYKNIPVTLGEFSADNENGLNYNTGVYGENGGPYNASRIEYHRYIAEQSINRGFSFSAWDAGNKSTKTIHLRTDNPTTNNVIEGTWVTEVRDALLSSGSWPLCYGSTENILILNPDFECGFNSYWSFNVQGNAEASYSDATTNSRSGNSGAKIIVTTPEVFNKVILSNVVYQQDLTDKKVTIKTYAKSLAESGQSFKIRVKAVVNGTNSYVPSPEFILNNEYPTTPFEFQYTIPDNTESIQIQVLLGNDEGTYFLDDFETVIEDAGTLSSIIEPLEENEITVYPNPTSDLLYVKTKSTSKILVTIYDFLGKRISEHEIYNSHPIHLSSLENGFYIAVLKNEETIKSVKIIKQK
ncbi:MAG: Endoglucanase H [Flavobacterium sp. SCGC AAA160-P02]|nr:MAG: Endoglucanase H [Flavobacterium sp. SCGC AAA160-P02]